MRRSWRALRCLGLACGLVAPIGACAPGGASAGDTGVAHDAARPDIAPRDESPADAQASLDASVAFDGADDGEPPDVADESTGSAIDAPDEDAFEAREAAADEGSTRDRSDEPDDAARADAVGEGSVDAARTGPGEPFAIEGFGRDTRGGWQPEHDVVFVTSLADDGDGTLRAALRTEGRPRVIRFAIDGAIELASPLLVPSNVTVDGRGRDVRLRRKGLVLPGVSEVIVTNVVIESVGPNSEDGVQIGSATLGTSRNIVLDHVSFLQQGSAGDSRNVDEAISVVFGARDITVQWCRFERWEKVMLLGNGDAPAALDEQITVTAHHNYALATGRRHPEARYGRFDFYDNYWDDWRMYGWVFEPPFRDSFAMHCRDRCRLLSENNAFRRTGSLMDVGSRAEYGSSCASGGVLEERGAFVAPGSAATIRFGVDCTAGARAFVRPYPTPSLEPASAALVARLVADSGAHRDTTATGF